MEKLIASKERPISPLPEIALQHEIRERGDYAYQRSGALWYWNMVDGVPFDTETKAKMLLAQKAELPYLVSGVLERTCNLQCDHCLYQDEKSSAKESERTKLFETITHIVENMPPVDEESGYSPKFMSAGRILRPEHLKLFEALRSTRPDVGLGVIDNGTFTKLLPRWPQDFKFDWIDISIDGTEEHHNTQRASARAYDEAMEGLRHAREVIRGQEEGGYVSSLFTLTNINSGDLKQVAATLLENQENGLPLVDKLKITTVSPTNAVNSMLETNRDDLAKAWSDLVEVCQKYNTDPENPRVDLGIYRVEDIEKLASVLGEKRFLELFPSDTEEAGQRISVKGNFLSTVIDGVPVSYLPLSIWPPEEFLIDADAAYRVAYEGQFTLNELQSGMSKDGRDTKAFTTDQLTPETDFRGAFENTVDNYWQNFGAKRLELEFAAFSRIRAKGSF